MTLEIGGQAHPRFEAVKDRFARNFLDGLETGARFSIVIEGDVVVDLWAGSIDRKGDRPFDQTILTPIFSTTKAVAAVMMARLVDAGQITYDQAVASIWPEFAAAGKHDISIGQLMSHQAGLAAFMAPFDPQRWLDPSATCTALATMAPLWEPGSASGYHPITIGYILGELFERIDGRTMGTALRQDVCQPMGLDLWIGLPPEMRSRMSGMIRPSSSAPMGDLTPLKRAAFLERWSSPPGRGEEPWLSIEIPSANGHATALALARLMEAVGSGASRGVQVLSLPTMREASAEWIRGVDLVLGSMISWAAGFMRNPPGMVYGPGPNSFGHSGWGGSCAFADPDRRLGGAYVMNRQSTHLIGDPRPVGLIQAVYDCL